jgi:hypothetical protein
MKIKGLREKSEKGKCPLRGEEEDPVHIFKILITKAWN